VLSRSSGDGEVTSTGVIVVVVVVLDVEDGQRDLKKRNEAV